MPIRINLLSEAQAAEEQRRKDPVKRTLYGSIAIVSLVLIWCISLQLKLMAAKYDLSNIDARWKSMETEYQAAAESQRQLIEAENRMSALERLRTNRFLWGSALNAIQQSLDGVEDIQVVRLLAEQKYTVQEAIKAKNDGPVPVRAQPAKSTERIVISLEAKDSSPEPGSRQISTFREAILSIPYFEENLQATNGIRLTSLSAPQTDGESGKPFVKFTLQCFFPEKVR